MVSSDSDRFSPRTPNRSASSSGAQGSPGPAIAALDGLRVVEIGDETVLYCGKLLADMGADVIHVERPGGDAVRRAGPFLSRDAGPESSVLHRYWNTSKRFVELDLHRAEDRARLRALMLDADLVVESLSPGKLDAFALGHAALVERRPDLVVTSITGFGQTGPWHAHRWSDLVVDALGGALYVTGEPDDPPVALAGSQAFVFGGALAASSSLIALRHALRTGRGQHVDVSLEEAVASSAHITGVGRWLEDGVIPRRSGTALTASCPSGAYPCRDGLVYLMVNRPAHWKSLARWIHEETGETEVLRSDFEGPSSARIPYRELLDLFITELTARHSVQAFFHEGQRRHIAVTPLNDVAGVLADPQLAARGFFVELEPGGASRVRMPGAPYRLSKTPWRISRPAPRIGDAAAGFLAEGLRQRAPCFRPRPGSTSDAGYADPQGGPLSGLRIVEFGAGMAGPWIGRIMAWCGAEVVKVESRRFPDVTRLYVSPRHPERGIRTRESPWFTDWNAGKRFVSLDLDRPEAIGLCMRLIERADVVIDNYSVETLEKRGLGADRLLAANPALVHLRSTGFGATGPYRSFVSWGPNIESHSAFAILSGFPHRPCSLSQFAYPDSLSAMHGLFALLCALIHRAQSGCGQSIDLSQLEVSVAALGERIVSEQIPTAAQGRRGNRSPRAAPNGCYACAGEDRWVAISVSDDPAFGVLCRAIGRPELEADRRFATARARRENADALDRILSDWTSSRKDYDVMEALQSAGVAAGVIQTVSDQLRLDPQLEHRGYFERIQHLVKGEVIANGIPLGLTATPGRTWRAGEALGHDNEYVFGGLLGLDESELERLVALGVIERRPYEG